MSLSNPETRRALRSVVQAVVALAVIGIVGWVVHLLKGEPEPLREIALACLAIVFTGTLLYGAENVTRAIKLSIGKDGASASIGDTIKEPDE